MAIARRVPSMISLGAKFLDCMIELSCFIEGEYIVLAQHFVLVGVKQRTDDKFNTVGPCLQAKPHTIVDRLQGIFSDAKIVNAECSRRSGKSE